MAADGDRPVFVHENVAEDAGDPVIHDRYRMDGEDVEVAIRAEETTIAYASGSERSVPTAVLRFCPDCLRDGRYPFGEGGGACLEHDAPRIPFDLQDYERFKLVHQYGTSYGANPF